MDKMPPPRSRNKYMALMSPNCQKAIRNAKERSASSASQISQISIASSAISDYLGGKINALIAEKDELQAYKDGLLEADREKTLGKVEFQAELDRVQEDLLPIIADLKTYRKTKRFIEQDLEQHLEDTARHEKRPRDEEPGIDFYERAYAYALTPRVMGVSAKQQKKNFSQHDQARFRQAVLERYGALRKLPGQEMAWCHITCDWWPKNLVKAAHLVPKALSGDEIAFLFDVGELVLTDPKNGISLHRKIEIALDSGKIVIVPLPTADYAACTWKCVLVDQSMRDLVAYSYGLQQIIYWKDLDGRELQFQTECRPARRYLYFRFLITYLFAKQSGNVEFTSTVDSRQTFWASPGEYLERSTLRSLARNISGLELPPAIMDHTFYIPTSVSETNDTSTVLASVIRGAATASSQRWDEQNNSDEQGFLDEEADNESEEMFGSPENYLLN